MQSAEDKSVRTIDEVLTRYELYARAAGFSQHRIKQMRSCLGLFDQFLQGILDVRDVTTDDFRRFLADLRVRPMWPGAKYERSSHLSDTTIATYGRAVKTFFHWLHSEGIITNNPLANVKIPRVPKMLREVYSEKELIAVFHAAATNIRDQAIFYLFLDSGIRLTELSSLKIGDVDTQSGSLKVYGKNKKERFSYFQEAAASAIDRYIEKSRKNARKDEFLFLTDEGNRFQGRGIQAMLLRLGKKAGISKRLSSHKLRHTFATLSLKNGGNLEYIRKIMGHTSAKTTEGYLNVQDADVSAAHRLFSPLSKLQDVITGKKSDLPPGAKPGDRVEMPTIQGGQQYVETPHKQRMRESAEDLINGLNLPWIEDSFIVEFWPGQLFLGKQRFPIYITEKLKIILGLTIIGTGETGILQKALRDHLETAGLSKVLMDILQWSEHVSDYLNSCHELLRKVRKEIEVTLHTSIQVKFDNKSGFKMNFATLICAVAVGQASGAANFQNFQYKYEGSILRFGASIIYIGVPNEDLKSIEDIHKNLIIKCTTWPQTRTIVKQRRDLENIATITKQPLQKFIAMERLPGHCELCS